jgi:hypothetical protein
MCKHHTNVSVERITKKDVHILKDFISLNSVFENIRKLSKSLSMQPALGTWKTPKQSPTARCAATALHHESSQNREKFLIYPQKKPNRSDKYF